MSIALSALLYQLTDTCDYKIFNKIDISLTYENIQLYDFYQDSYPIEQSLYYISSGTLKTRYNEFIGAQIIHNCTFICYCPEDYKVMMTLCPSISVIFIKPKSDSSFSKVFNTILRIFNSFENWNKSLHLSILNGTSMQMLLDLSRSILTHPMLVMDSNFTVIGKLEIPTQEDSYMSKILETGYMSPELISYYRRAGFLPDDYHEESPHICKYQENNTSSYYSMYYTMSDSSNLYGYIFIFHCNNHPGNSYQYLMDMVKENLSLYFKQKQNKKEHSPEPYDRLLSSILARSDPSQKQIESQLASIPNLGLNGNFVLAQLKSEKVIKNYFFLHKNIKNAFPNLFPFQYEGNMYLLKSIADTDKCFEDFIEEDKLEQFKECMCGNNFCFIVSQPFFTLTDLPAASRQCTMTIKYLEGYSQDSPFYYYRDFKIYYLLRKLDDSYTGQMLRSPHYQIIHKYDFEHKTDLCQVLAQYLKNDRNVGKTAAAIFMHRNTVLNKVKKCFSLIGCELEDYEQALFFLLNYEMDKKE